MGVVCLASMSSAGIDDIINLMQFVKMYIGAYFIDCCLQFSGLML